jgi:hypothetical protein
MTLSVVMLFLSKVPDCCSNLSTRVVLPWSTWAIMAIFRRFLTVMMFLKRRDYKGFLGNFYELFDLKKDL